MASETAVENNSSAAESFPYSPHHTEKISPEEVKPSQNVCSTETKSLQQCPSTTPQTSSSVGDTDKSRNETKAAMTKLRKKELKLAGSILNNFLSRHREKVLCMTLKTLQSATTAAKRETKKTDSTITEGKLKETIEAKIKEVKEKFQSKKSISFNLSQSEEKKTNESHKALSPPTYPIVSDLFRVTYQRLSMTDPPKIVSEVVVDGLAKLIPEWIYVDSKGWRLRWASVHIFATNTPQPKRRNSIFGNQPNILPKAGDLLARYCLSGCHVEMDPYDSASFIIYFLGRNILLHFESLSPRKKTKNAHSKNPSQVGFKIREPSGEEIREKWISRVSTCCVPNPTKDVNVESVLKHMLGELVRAVDDASMNGQVKKMKDLKNTLRQTTEALYGAVRVPLKKEPRFYRSVTV